MRSPVLSLMSVAAIAAAAGCEARSSSGPTTSAPLVDVATLAPVRAAFNAHKGEARFLTLLSPT